ncbi:MAG TPA: serine/threonine-protein kinase [Gemmatimonadales bacterium]|nr:serine/threonine-protein kinase [Gemmatimonadales bacterium]HRX18236.1 serine/threonine-protein kinase [Gemmatimonadales bacterium]
MERELGRGGMGTVWLARDVRLDRLVAIKVLHPDLAADPVARERFVAEARTAARLAHPHVVPVFAVEAAHDPPLIVMALVDGETAAARLARRGALPAAEVERILREIAWALGYAHAAGVVHRDLTLANILLERETGRALLADFGLAVAREAPDGSPVFGTPGYLAPELIRGELADARSDLYALGVVGYTLLAGRPPFRGDSTGEVLARHLVAAPDPLGPQAAGAPRRLVELIETCLAKEPAQRPRDADEVLARLDRTPETVAIAPPLADWFARWERIRPIYALATPILGLQPSLLVWGYFSSGRAPLLAAAVVTTLASMTAIPVAIHLASEVSALRRLQHHGFGIDDIRAAWPHWAAQLQERYDRDGLRPLAGRVIFDLTAIGALLLVVTFGYVLPFGTEGYVRSALLSMASTLFLAVMTGVSVGVLAPGFRFKPTGWFRRTVARFWHSRAASLVTRLAGARQHDRLAATQTLHRSTELVLGLAIEEIWRSLPVAVHREVGDDVPTMAATLRRAAEELRHLAEQMREAEAQLPFDAPERIDLAGEREQIEEQQRQAVATLERLRLQLLRTMADRRPTADLTTQLERARELERDLVRGVIAHDEVRRLLRGAARRGGAAARTPTPTPVGA